MKKVMKKKILLTLFSLLGLLVISMTADVQNVNANNDPGGATGFTYKVSYPENQMEENLGYYKLKMNPNDQQVIKIALTNPGSEKLTVNVRLNGAKTNQNGVIEYGDSIIENDSSLKIDFKDIVTAPKTVELGPGETKDLDLTIKMPAIAFDGTLAGGVQLMRADQGEKDKKAGSQIINQYAYIVGILLQETDKVIEPKLELNSVKADQDNARNAIFVNVSNIEAAYLNDITAEVQITEKDNDAVIYERKQTAMRMAPNSFINFPISMNGEKMKAGKYKAKILMISGDKKWSWDQEFEIKQKDADRFNERDVGLVQEKGIDWQTIGLIVGGILLVIMIVFGGLVFIRKRNNRKRPNKTSKKKSSKTQASNKPKKKKQDS
ncbi:hypothetical protein ATZ33_07295 [Enterococcus silesiacus]|uniref:Uncharacterized protein n=1 Tax=Enterococcus silesiacus TaxID=332949 RepID=A0A0S3KA37_9ENTE|nr:DUF916 and DUF3324 domain-containing protein [Enterococcus silesiacus]ALS01181.1 hypothetical protein ATZ33_07295 [Enterococcus silesiacus]OJG92576.1 hypothetical protein RV15_GL003001 [Enterococcus silesiacus]